MYDVKRFKCFRTTVLLALFSLGAVTVVAQQAAPETNAPRSSAGRTDPTYGYSESQAQPGRTDTSTDLYRAEASNAPATESSRSTRQGPRGARSRTYSAGGSSQPSEYSYYSQYGQSENVAPITRPESRVMVIPTREVRAAQFAAISEDLRVMLHILKQRTAEGRPHGFGVVFSDFGDFFQAHGPSFEALYLQGHGVLFFLQAEFDMVSTPPADPDTGSPELTHVDPVWQSARLAMRTPKGSKVRSVRSTPRVTSDELAAEIITGIKHAANIRFLTSAESITIRILRKDAARPGSGYVAFGRGGDILEGGYGGGIAYGGGGGGYGGAVGRGTGGASYWGHADVPGSEPPSQAPTGHSRQTPSSLEPVAEPSNAHPVSPRADSITIHVLKSDVDDYAQDRIPLEEFKRRVTVLKY